MPATPPAIEFPLTPSRYLWLGWSAAHLVTAGLIVAVAAHWPAALLALAAVAASAWLARQRAARLASWRHLRWSEGELCLSDAVGQCCGRLRGASLAGPRLIVLDWDGPFGAEHLLLFSDSAAAEDLRRLRVQLRAWQSRPAETRRWLFRRHG